MEQYIYPAFLVLSIGALVFYLYKTHTRWLGTVCVRAICGILAILLINGIFRVFSISCSVGVNLVTIPTIGLLGGPGLILIYGVEYFFMRV